MRCLLLLCVLTHSNKFSLNKKYAHTNFHPLNGYLKSYSENNFQNFLAGPIYTLKGYITSSLQNQRLATFLSVVP